MIDLRKIVSKCSEIWSAVARYSFSSYRLVDSQKKGVERNKDQVSSKQIHVNSWGHKPIRFMG